MGTGTTADFYTVNGTSIIYDDGMGESEWSMSYAADIVQHSDFTNAHGVIIIKFTTNPVTGGEKAYSAVYWRGLTAASVSMANATEDLGENVWDASVDNKDDAITKFTESKADDYVTWDYVQPFRKTN
jgi:hypothetical protein